MNFEAELTRRQVLAAGMAALVSQALPLARACPGARPRRGAAGR